MPEITSSPTQILMAEHEVILRVLDCLDRVAHNFERAPDLRSARDILGFLGEFADRCHHGKEESCLFPALVAKGVPREVGPVAVMLAEHVEGRSAVAGMRAALADCEKQAGPGGEASQRFVAHARSYTALLREHIAKENEVLFPLADGMLDEREQARVLEAYASVEHHDMGEGTHERYLALADELVERLGVTPAKAASAHGGGGCCGHGRFGH